MILLLRSHHWLSPPSWPLTALTLVLCVTFLALGRWQMHRAQARQEEWDGFARGADQVLPLGATRVQDIARFARVSVTGHLRPDRQFLLDNRSHAGQPGYEVLTPLELADGRALLVDRGWVAFTGSRTRLPDIAFAPPHSATLVGRVDDLPSAGLAFGRAPPGASGSWPRLTAYPTMPELSAAFGHALAPRIVLLDPLAATGFVRDWQPPGLPPARHWAYAIQWWCFALALVVLWIVLAVRRARVAR
jgi:cytochrome oxidase assembly protein ShyY1